MDNADVRFRFGAEGIEATKRLIDSVGDSLQNVGKKGAEAAAVGGAAGFRNIANELQSVGKSAGLAVLGIGGAATAIGALSLMVRNAVDLGAELDDLSQSTGASVENLSKLRDLARSTGYDFEGVTAAVSKLNAAIFKAERSENSPAARGLASIGLSAKELQKLDPADALREVAKAFAEVEDGSAKAAAAQAIFKDASVLAYLNDLADDAGRVASVTSEQAKRATQLQDAMNRMSVSASNAAQTFALEFVPALADVAKFTEEAQSKLGPLLGTFVGVVGGGALKLFGVELDQLKRSQAEATELFEKRQKIVFELGKARAENWDPSLIRELERQRDSIGAQLKAANSEVKRLQAESAAGVKKPARKVDSDVLGANASAVSSIAKEYTEGSAAAKAYGKTIADLIKIEQDAANKGDNLTKAQSLLRDLMDSPTWAQMDEPWRDMVVQYAAAADAAEGTARAQNEITKAVAAWAEERLRATENIDQQIAAQYDENAAIGLTAESAAQLAIAKLDVAAAGQREYAESLRIAAEYAGPVAEAYRQAAEDAEAYAAKLLKLAEARRAGVSKEASAQAAADAAKAWQRAGEQIEQSLTDAIMRGFEGGKSLTENFIDSIENSLKTAALRLSIQLVYSAAGSGLSAILGGAGGDSGSNGGTAGGLGQFTGALSSASSLYGYAGSAASLWSAFAGTSAGGTAGGFAAGWSGGAGAIGSGLSAAGNGYAVSGAGQALGGISKVAWPLAVLYGMYMSGKAYDAGYKMDSSVFGGGTFGHVAKSITDVFTLEPLLEKIIGKRAAAILTGSSLAAQIITGLREKLGAGGEKVGGEDWFGGQAQNLKNTSNADGSLRGTVNDVGARIADLAKAFGGSSAAIKFGLGFDSDPKGKADSSVSASLYGQDGKLVYTQTGVSAGRSQEELSAALGLQATRLMIAGLKASNIDAAIKGVLDQYNLNTLTEAQAQEALKAASAMQQLGLSVGELWRSLGQNADTKIGSLSNRRDLAQLFGGLDQLSSAVGSAYDALLTEQQKVDLAQKNMVRYFGDLNIALPKSNAELLSLIEAQDLTTEAGRKTYSSLVSLAPAFAQLQQSMASAGDAAAQAAQAAADAAAAAFAKLQSDAEAYFRGVDRAANLRSYTQEAAGALDVMFGAVADGAAASAQAAADAASQAVGAWQSAVSSIGGTLQDIRTGSLSNLSPEARYNALRDQFGSATAAARGGDANAAQQLGTLAQNFLQASRDYFGSGGAFQADLAAVDGSLAQSLESAKAQVSVQQSIQAASAAAVDELQRLNTSLSGFAGEALDLLRAGYAGSSREAGAAAVQQLASLQSTIDYTLSSLAAGASMQGNGYKLNKLDGGLAALQFDSGKLEYIRAGESVLEIAKRIPELRAQWEAMFGIKLPAYASGTAFVQGDQIARIHHGEKIINAADSAILNKYGIPTQPDPGLLREMLEELRAARAVQQGGFSASVARLAALERKIESLEAETRQARMSAERNS